MEFFVEESCGQCTPCRIGNVKLLEGVQSIEDGIYTFSNINKLKELGKTMQVASKCGLGQSSPNAFLSIIENFKDEIFAYKVGGENGKR
jgi:[NiFe] hydrogenase diaphorase moiety large subunit